MSEKKPDTPLTSISSHDRDELEVLRKRRSALQEIVRVTLSIEKLKQGLTSLLLVGKPPSDIPRSALKLFESLSRGVSHYSTKRLQESLAAIELGIQAGFEQVMAIADVPDTLEATDSADHEQDIERLHNLIHEFRRRVQTAVALALLLRERGIHASEISLPVSRDDIESRIEQLAREEQQCRQRLETEMNDMLAYVDFVLQQTDEEGSLHTELAETRQQLQLNLRHLASGQQLEEMPIVFEMIEMGGTEDHRIPFTPTSLPDAPPATSPEKDGQATQDHAIQPAKRHGFFTRLRIWLTTPLGVRWRDIDRHQKK
jgi:hypothetical protein